ncbi:BZ3500_MvSof-1268-A1-R1_Chr1-1g01276 [Microbotryum saponariae]|uniref:BZ3500_MvSof-1268-A1-R1_Chr1-1g01276 protein n=1 Tax=Microbotryum saponariae TaxID=289078 RepID=A0A2X0KBA4_9BASI|nr:BZ3500_MvSof-1268-A1-R1_Chr1-1g01276 [Microbotryum saponariae]SCZ93856.1 BZ3501_MvSof-1269-A2-R1_Chr1-1g00872 [Microbotryum saponariae]
MSPLFGLRETTCKSFFLYETVIVKIFKQPPLIRAPHPRHYGSLSGCELLIRDIAAPPPDANFGEQTVQHEKPSYGTKGDATQYAR